MEEKKYLDMDGLKLYDKNLKEYINKSFGLYDEDEDDDNRSIDEGEEYNL